MKYLGTFALRSLLALILVLFLILPGKPASALISQFFRNDPAALQVEAGNAYDMHDTAWLLTASGQNKNTFAYKLFSALLMLGYQTEIAVNGISGTIPHLLALHAFQVANGLTIEDVVTDTTLAKIDSQLTTREEELAPLAQRFQLYDHMMPLHANDVSKDTLSVIYSLPMQVLPKYLQMSLYEEVQCINSQCNGFIQDQYGAPFSYWPINLTDEYRFVGAYFDPVGSTARKPSAAVHVQTVLHEYAHYLDGYYKVFSNNPLYKTFKIVDTTTFYDIGYNLNDSPKSGCYVPKSINPQDWISKYAAQMPGYGGCPAGSAVLDEDWAESFSMYVASGRDFRAAALKSAFVAEKYNWLKDHVFSGLEYDTDLVRDTESGCNDVYLYGATGVPGYAHCNNNYIWDFTLKPLAATVDTTPGDFVFAAHSAVEISTAVTSNSVTVGGINWPSVISVTGGEYSINGGSYVSTAGTVHNGEAVTVRLTSSVYYSSITDAVLTIGGVSSTFSVTTRTPVQPTIAGFPATAALTGAHYSFTPAANNTITFSLGGSVPPGLQFNTATGTISGTPTTPGSYGPIIITAINGNLTAALTSFTIEVSSPIGIFSPSGEMSAGRLQHTATLLANGKVLVAGGYDDFGALSSVELYDPSTGTWSKGTPMLTARAEHSATLLPDGSLLVTGGYDDNYNTLASAERYNPATDSWTAVAPPFGTRAGHTATLLTDGMILVAGGTDNGQNTTRAELYDPTLNIWKSAASMSSNRCYHTSTLLQDGTVLVIGGYDVDWNPLSSAELYNPTDNTWRIAAPLQQTRVNHTATRFSDGSILVTGGSENSSTNPTGTERYNPVTARWAAAAAMPTQRSWHTATLLNDCLLLVTGGFGTNGTLATGEVYSISTDTWLPSEPLVNSKAQHTATLLENGQILLVGGTSSVTYATTDSQLFDAGASAGYCVTPSADAGSLISPAAGQNVTSGTTTSFSIIPVSGYGILSVSGCGGSLHGGTYTTGAVSASCTVQISTVARTGTNGSTTTPTIRDALKVIRSVVNQTPLSATDQIRYDVSPLAANGKPLGNGVIDVADAILILRRSLGLVRW